MTKLIVMGANWYDEPGFKPETGELSPRIDVCILGKGDAAQVDKLASQVPAEHQQKVLNFLEPFRTGKFPMRRDWYTGKEIEHIGTYETKIVIWWKRVTESML